MEDEGSESIPTEPKEIQYLTKVQLDKNNQHRNEIFQGDTQSNHSTDAVMVKLAVSCSFNNTNVSDMSTNSSSSINANVPRQQMETHTVEGSKQQQKVQQLDHRPTSSATLITKNLGVTKQQPTFIIHDTYDKPVMGNSNHMTPPAYMMMDLRQLPALVSQQIVQKNNLTLSDDHHPVDGFSSPVAAPLQFTDSPTSSVTYPMVWYPTMHARRTINLGYHYPLPRFEPASYLTTTTNANMNPPHPRISQTFAHFAYPSTVPISNSNQNHGALPGHYGGMGITFMNHPSPISNYPPDCFHEPTTVWHAMGSSLSLFPPNSGNFLPNSGWSLLMSS